MIKETTRMRYFNDVSRRAASLLRKIFPRERVLFVLLAVVYFCIVTPAALVWRLLLRRGLMHVSARWVATDDATDKPDLFNRTA